MIIRAATRIIDAIGYVLFAAVALAIIVSMFAGTADVLMLQITRQTLRGSVEFSQNLMPVIVFGSLAYIQKERQHIRVEFIYDRLGSRGRAVLDLLNSVIVTFASAALAWVSWQGFQRSNAIKESGMAFPFPIYPVKFFIVVGLVVMIVKMTVEIFASIARIIHPEEERTSLDRLLEQSIEMARPAGGSSAGEQPSGGNAAGPS